MNLKIDLPAASRVRGPERAIMQAGHSSGPPHSPAGSLKPVLPDPAQMDSRLLAQEEERLRLGRELHDSTGQLLLALRLGISHLRQVHGTGAEVEVIAEIEETALRIDREIRSFAFSHYPATIGHEGLGAALHYLARGFGVRTGLCIKFSDECRQRIEDGPVAVALLRVAQEALTNVHRHAHAGHVKVNLAEEDGQIELSIRDDGRGISPEFANGSFRGVGLQGMRHRVERLGGIFSIRRLKHGTRLLARVPLPA
jgi:signal transduction histidine kinase